MIGFPEIATLKVVKGGGTHTEDFIVLHRIGKSLFMFISGFGYGWKKKNFGNYYYDTGRCCGQESPKFCMKLAGPKNQIPRI